MQGGMANTQNANGYFRYCNITFPTKYKTTPNFVAVVMNYQSTAIDARLCTLVKNITTTGAQVFVADSQGQIGNQGYQIQWIAVGEIN